MPWIYSNEGGQTAFEGGSGPGVIISAGNSITVTFTIPPAVALGFSAYSNVYAFMPPGSHAISPQIYQEKWNLSSNVSGATYQTQIYPSNTYVFIPSYTGPFPNPAIAGTLAADLDGGCILTAVISSNDTGSGQEGPEVYLRGAATTTPGAYLTASPTLVAVGGSARLNWASGNAASATINNGVGAVTPNTSAFSFVSPSVTTTYTLTVVGTNGSTIYRTATVSVVSSSSSSSGSLSSSSKFSSFSSSSSSSFSSSLLSSSSSLSRSSSSSSSSSSWSGSSSSLSRPPTVPGPHPPACTGLNLG